MFGSENKERGLNNNKKEYVDLLMFYFVSHKKIKIKKFYSVIVFSIVGMLDNLVEFRYGH